MSITNDISILLNIKDKNITFTQNCVKEEKIDNVRTIIINGYLDSKITRCLNCSGVNIVKNGTKSSDISVPKMSQLNTILRLSKQRYQCKDCKSYITSSTSVVDKGCHISNNTKHAVINQAKEIKTNKQIANDLNISRDSVQRYIDSVYSTDKLYKHFLPKAICFDEITYQKGRMAFTMCNADTGKTIDLVYGRSLENLVSYFSYYSMECRKKVKYIVIDMYKPYFTLINKMFPKAKIIIDKFHIVQLMSKALNKTRINIMKSDKVNYRKFKRYWRLLLTSRFDLKCSYWQKYLCFKNLMTEVDIVNYLLDQNEELKASYNLYQNLLYAIQNNNYKVLVKALNTDYGLISNQMKTVLKTMREYLPYIRSTLKYHYSNGVMERNNNTCKLLKRIAFGFRNFVNFKAKVLIVTSLFRPSKKTNGFLSISPQSS